MSVVLITGASSGIGKELAKLFAMKKYNLILLARNTEKLENIKRELEKEHSISAKIISYDLNNIKALKEIIKENNFNILINCAGFGEITKFDNIRLEKDLEMLNVNFLSPFILTRLFLEKALLKDEGIVVNICSTAALYYHPYMATYSTSKKALLSYSLSVSEEIKYRTKNVSVISICPGPTDTNFFKKETKEKFGKFKIWEMSAEKVAKEIEGVIVNKNSFAIIGLRNKFLTKLLALLPINIQLKCVEKNLRKILN